jgi:hypothetical protein
MIKILMTEIREFVTQGVTMEDTRRMLIVHAAALITVLYSFMMTAFVLLAEMVSLLLKLI